ncbi:ABC-type branched-subunit amino acid transport system substrate-binding protein [Phenylobacterium haematophilum]|uniref:ABC-type branched-subunit amino acid transport system substrate-binding protein n=1 Tax=Phenylobacterium haematophilum TaxID=98513 RepID=A0A839ZZF4_9CAUL|nr:ABC transporter substrate-binding protein [Phenylobacterium haematophilum]MBB3890630.1 ABC-type branched-subunit amino acid transport system substrate-binding protein [Phenylobacterium haematophilum]
MSTSLPSIPIGVLIPMTPPGWVEAGRHLLAGFELAVEDINKAGGVSGRAMELLVRDSAGDADNVEAAVRDVDKLGIVALAGEFHSVAARRAASTAIALGLPFLCSSAVIDELTAEVTDWVARLAPPQSKGWRDYAEFLLQEGHARIAVVSAQSPYWQAGIRILRDNVRPRGGEVIELISSPDDPSEICNQIAACRATALLLLVGYPEPAISIVEAIRADVRLRAVLIGAPAGQPEFPSWETLLRGDGAAIPFLQYRPERLTQLGQRVEVELHRRLNEAPSFVALEGYDSIIVLADILRTVGVARFNIASSWASARSEGTRGTVQFTQAPGSPIWQWTSAPVQIADRDPAAPTRFRRLYPEQAASP